MPRRPPDRHPQSNNQVSPCENLVNNKIIMNNKFIMDNNSYYTRTFVKFFFFLTQLIIICSFSKIIQPCSGVN